MSRAGWKKPNQKSSDTPQASSVVLQRKRARGAQASLGGESEGRGKHLNALQRKSLNDAGAEQAPPIAREVLNSPGQPLSEEARAFFEPKFEHDFSRVRVHTDARAAESARAVDASAYTVGRDVVFGAAEYAPETMAGRGLLAHELSHVVQQGGRRLVPQTGLRIGSSSESDELSADRAARTVMGGGFATETPRAGAISLARKPRTAGKTGAKLLNYSRAEQQNKKLAEPEALGWAGKLDAVAGGQFKPWADLWAAADYEVFADAVAVYQRDTLGFTGKDADGILGLVTWARIAGLGEAIAGITDVKRAESENVCTIASEERIKRGQKLATGQSFNLPKDLDAKTFNIILQSIESKMADVEEQYRGTGAAGALVYAGLGQFVAEDQIWSGGLRPGAAIQVWKHRNAYDLMKAGVIEEKGKTRRINSGDADFYGTSFVFVRYDPAQPNDRMQVRHFGDTEWKKKSNFDVWVAANTI